MTSRTPILFLLCCGIVSGCSRSTLPQPQPHPVSLARVSAGMPTASTERYTAVVLPNQQVDLSFRTGGYVQWIAQRRSAAGGMRALDAGDLILANAPLARLRVPEMQSQLEQAGASISGSVAARKGAEAQMAQARADAEHAEEDWARAQRLYAQAAMTKPDYEAAKNKHLIAQAQVSQAAEAIATEASRVQASQAQRAEAGALLAETELRSPFAGVVLTRGVNVGSLVASGGAAFTVAEIDKVNVAFSVTDAKIGSLHLGDRLSVLCDAVSPQPLTGIVTVVAAGADGQSSTFRVEVTLVNGDHRIRPGMVAAVVGPTANKRGGTAATVPLTSLVHRPEIGSNYGVFVVTEENERRFAHLQSVQVGSIEGNKVAILGGLNPGMEVVMRGNADLRDGDLVVNTTEGEQQ
jgi:HlyD family secretion protein